MRRPSKPIRVFYSVLSERFYATRAWREIKPGLVECTGEKWDVTNDIAFAIERHEIDFTRVGEHHATDQEQVRQGGRQEHQG